jgi:hypothetical protein
MGRPVKHARKDPSASNTNASAAPKAPKEEEDRWPDGQHLWGKYGSEWRECEVLESRPRANAEKKEYLYYVHWIDFNRRMDAWVDLVDLLENHPLEPGKEFQFQVCAGRGLLRLLLYVSRFFFNMSRGAGGAGKGLLYGTVPIAFLFLNQSIILTSQLCLSFSSIW